MKGFLKFGSQIFHPLWMPLAGTLVYFLISPRFFPLPIVKAKLLAIAILTVFIPVIFAFLIKNLGLISSIHLRKVKERRLPLLFFSLLLLTILNFIVESYRYPELYYFFSGILYSSLLALLSSIFRLKVSLHMMGAAGFTTFLIALSVLYGTNLTYIIGFLIFILGWIASSRLLLKAHNEKELLLGFVFGVIPQLLLLFIPNFFN